MLKLSKDFNHTEEWEMGGVSKWVIMADCGG